MIKRGDVYYADLDPVIGSEQKGHRPIIVIQNDCCYGNKQSEKEATYPRTCQRRKLGLVRRFHRNARADQNH